jgi:hypothetical protein
MWSTSFYIAYDETFVKDSKSYTFNGQMYYDANNNRQRADKVDGKYDGICGSILPNVSTPCQHLVVENKRFIVFPKKQQCCFCCDAEHGCGLLKPDWFVDGEYLGQEKIVDTMFDKWNKKGTQTFYLEIPDAIYWATADENQTPRRFSEDDATHIIDYLPHTFVNKTIPASVFALPSYCSASSSCPLSSKCGKFRGSPNVRSE